MGTALNVRRVSGASTRALLKSAVPLELTMVTLAGGNSKVRCR
jgi:hypothetical protein